MFDAKRYPTLAHAYEWSNYMLARIQEAFLPLAETTPEIFTIAVSGSYGRLEAMAHSDCDLIVLVEDHVMDDQESCQKIMRTVWCALKPLELKLPKPTGIYAIPNSHAQICDCGTLGLIADDPNIFGKRIQLLLDSKPVFREYNFQTLIQKLLERYAAGFLIYDQSREWVYLLNDLIRYFRTYCAWRQFDLTIEPNDSWYMRNAKLRSSRVMMFAALIVLLGECSKQKKDKIGWLKDHLALTPLERFQFVYTANKDDGFIKLLDAYEFFLTQMGSPRVRKILVESGPNTLAELQNERPPEYQALHTHSAGLLSELSRFILARRNDWSQVFFEYLLL